MNRRFTSLSLLGLLLLGTSGEALGSQRLPPGTNYEPAPVHECEGFVSFDEVLYPVYPALVGSAFVAALKAKDLSRLVATALNSEGDELKLALSGELYLPVLGAVSAGGAVDLEVTLSRHRTESGAIEYWLRLSEELAGGLQASAGIAGAGLDGVETVATFWKFSTQAEVVEALQGLMLQAALLGNDTALGEKLERQLAERNSNVRQLESIRNAYVGWLARFLPGWVLDKLNAVQAARQKAQRALSLLLQLREKAQASEAFFRTRPAYLELELGAKASASIGAQVIDAAGDTGGVIGGGYDGELDARATVIAEMRDGVPIDAEFGVRFQNPQRVSGGLLGSVAVAVEATLTLSGWGEFTTGGFEVSDTSDRVELSFDRSYTPSAWAGVGAQYAAGRTTTASLELTDLAELGMAGVQAFLSGDPLLVAGLLVQLPVTFEGQARIERAAFAGLGGDVAEMWTAAGINVAAWWTDQGTTTTYDCTPAIGALASFASADEAPEEMQATLDVLTAVAREVGAE